ncbi:MAG: tRNA lysidine(34) synthetase TilS [Anaerolineaceae bacterium]
MTPGWTARNSQNRSWSGDISRGTACSPTASKGTSIKVSDIWVNTKLPRRARKNWPLVCCGNRIAWLPGYRPGGEFIVDASTRQVVKLSLSRTDLAIR